MPWSVFDWVLLMIGVGGLLLARPIAETRADLFHWSDEQVGVATSVTRGVGVVALLMLVGLRVFA